MTSTSPWDTTAPVASVGAVGGDVTLVEGQTFSISDRVGDMDADLPHGLFVLDTRCLSALQLRLNGHRLESVAVSTPEPFQATFVARPPAAHGQADADVVVFRRRHIGRGMRERIEVRNFGMEPADVRLDLHCSVDFADLFDVKESRAHPDPEPPSPLDDALVFTLHGSSRHRTATLRVGGGEPLLPVAPPPGRARRRGDEQARRSGHLTRTVRLAPGGTWAVCLELTVAIDDHPIVPRFSCGAGGEGAPSVPEARLAEWRAGLPTVSTDPGDLEASIARSGDDLGALRIFEPGAPDVPMVAAGAPWFMTVFGRDSLLTAAMSLPAGPSLARGVLRTLARFQGGEVSPDSEEEPGKILHEMRFGTSAGLTLDGGRCYYGSVDATPLFVVLLAELARWCPDDGLVDQLLPHADAAITWIEQHGDRDGDGFVEYQRASPDGLVNQGWKDSWDAVRFADGRLAEGPIALCEVQGYVYAAYAARAELARQRGDAATEQRCRERAEEIRRRFHETFWLEHEGTFALALDGAKRPVDAVTSNPGHCLWSGIVDPERAPLVADRLLADDLWSGWGVRTLAATMAAYNPVSYHNGSVWPHDNAIVAAGLGRYGLADHAHRVIEGQMAVAAASDHRLPELFAGFDRRELDVPGSYPASCSPQAWAAAAPLLWLRTLLRLDPLVPDGVVYVAPELPPSIRRLEVHGIPIGDQRLAVEVAGDRVHATLTEGGTRLAAPPRRHDPAAATGEPPGG